MSVGYAQPDNMSVKKYALAKDACLLLDADKITIMMMDKNRTAFYYRPTEED